jgi:hypothetical protein
MTFSLIDISQRFRWTCCLHFRHSETLLNIYQIAWRHIPGLHSDHRDNAESHGSSSDISLHVTMSSSELDFRPLTQWTLVTSLVGLNINYTDCWFNKIVERADCAMFKVYISICRDYDKFLITHSDGTSIYVDPYVRCKGKFHSTFRRERTIRPLPIYIALVADMLRTRSPM